MYSLHLASKRQKILLLCSLVGLASCSSTFKTYQELIEYAFFPGDGVQLSLQELKARPVASLYVKVADRPQSLLVLQAQDSGIQNWLSYDRATLTLQQGRVIKTTGFIDNLIYSQQPLPATFEAMNGLVIGRDYQSIQDFDKAAAQQQNHHYQILESNVQTLLLLQHNFQAIVFYEQVTFTDGSHAINEFWFEQDTKILLKSKQHISSFWPVLELIHVSDAAQLLIASQEAK